MTVADTSQPRPSDSFIPLYIVAFFLVITAVLATFVYIAVSSYRGVVTDDAYEKGVAYNKVIAQAEAQAASGYTLRIEQSAGGVTVHALDAKGDAVPAKAVKIWFYRPTQDGMDRHESMARQPDGAFGISTLGMARGLWEARVYADLPQGAVQSSKRIVLQ